MRNNRIPLLAAAAVVVAVLLVIYFIGSAIFVLGLATVVAYVLLPVARLLESAMPWRRRRPDLARAVAVALIFLAGIGIVVALAIAVIPPTISQVQDFAEGFPDLISDARSTVEFWLARYTEIVPASVRDQVEDGLAGAGDVVGQAIFGVIQQTLSAIVGSFSFVLGLAVAPVLIFYLMKDSTAIRRSLTAPFPARLRPHLDDVLAIADRTLGGYIRGQLLLGVVVGTIVAVGLLLLGVPFAVLLGVVAGVTELIPIIGPWIGGAVGVVVTLATEPDKVLWVLLLYLIVQLLENTLLVPRIQASTLNMHPVGVILTITIGSQYFGLWGIILGPPVVALAKEVAVYLVREWNKEPEPEDQEDDSEIAMAVEAIPEGEDK